MENVKATIITIGDELLIGQVIDTNSSWMAQELNKIGVAVTRRTAVGDEENDIIKAIENDAKEASFVLITGGLGPTLDDKTKQVLGDYFGGKMVVNQKALENVKYLFEKVYNKPVSKVNLMQAEVPDVCEVIQNKRGSAPGMIFKKEGTLFISMPGVPYEMQGMMEDVLIYIQQNRELPVILHRTVLTVGIGESALAEIIEDFEKHLPKEISLAYLPNYGMVRLRLSISGFDETATRNLINAEFEKLKKLVQPYLVSDEDIPMQEVLGKLLRKLNKTISTAESCTGGAIASLLISIPGASHYFEGSVVSYSGKIKKQVLKVSETTLQQHGEVSEETVKEMLKGVLNTMNTDYGIAVSGIMGPDGGSIEKPVGTVWVAIGSKEKQITQKWQHRYSRAKNIEVTCMMALNMMRKFIIENDVAANN